KFLQKTKLWQLSFICLAKFDKKIIEANFNKLTKRQVAFYKSKTSQEWDLAKFLEAMELDEYKNIIFL
ncbi:17896_t:CDS:1, partial [Gigaspora margarita]